jgi:hypothetical protein
MADYGSGGWGFESLAARTIGPGRKLCSRIPGPDRSLVQTDLVRSSPVWWMIRSADPWSRVKSPAILAMWQGRCEDSVEALRVLGVAIADQAPERPTLGQVEGEVPGLLGHPRCLGTPRRSCYVDLPGVDLDNEEHAQRAQPRRLHGEEVGGQDTPGLAAQELAPRRAGPPWGPGPGHRDVAAFGWPWPRLSPELDESSFDPQASPTWGTLRSHARHDAPSSLTWQSDPAPLCYVGVLPRLPAGLV